MSLLEIAQMGGGGILLLTILVEVAPIKINPWSWLAKAAGRALNGEMLDKLSALERDVRQIKDDAARREAVMARTRILRFGDEILHKELHTKEHFDQTLRDITSYEQYCDDHPEFENSCAVLTIQKIKDTYMERLEKNDFL